MSVSTVKYKLVTLLAVFTLLVLLFYKVQKVERMPYCDVKLPKLTTMADMVNILKLDRCGVLRTVFDLFAIEVEGVPIQIPKTFEKKVLDWLGGDEDLLKQAKHQKVIQITNKFSGETTHYNPLRAKRPGSQVIFS